MGTPNPDLAGLIDALIAHAFTDLQNPSGYLRPVLDLYGITIDTGVYVDPMGAITGTPTQYNGLVFGDPPIPGDGCSIHYYPNPVVDSPFLMPLIDRLDYGVSIKGFWKDNPEQVLQFDNRRYWRFVGAFSEALRQLYSPNALGANTGGWAIGSGFVFFPRCQMIDPASEQEIRGQLVLIAELEFTCFTTLDTP